MTASWEVDKDEMKHWLTYTQQQQQQLMMMMTMMVR